MDPASDQSHAPNGVLLGRGERRRTSRTDLFVPDTWTGACNGPPPIRSIPDPTAARDVSIRSWLEDDDLGLPRSRGGVGIQHLVVDGPFGPQAGSLVLVRGASADEA